MMDHPAVTNGLATEREVILFNNAGVSSSSGEVPTSFDQMAANGGTVSNSEGCRSWLTSR
jgi:hypothetical protein